MSDENSEGAASVGQTHVVLDWGDGTYTFRLGVGQIIELQEKCQCGLGGIFARMCAGRYIDRNGDFVLNPTQAAFKYEDVAETIRLALIGGDDGLVNDQPIKVSATKALQLVRRYVHPVPLMENWRVAYAVLAAFMVGYTDPDAEKKSPPNSQSEQGAQPKDGSTATAS